MQAQLLHHVTNLTAILQTVIFQSVVKLLQAAHFKVHQNVQWLLLKLQMQNLLLPVTQKLAAQPKQKLSLLLPVTQKLAAQPKQKLSLLLLAKQIATQVHVTRLKKLVALFLVACKPSFF
jgi:hypothetical protein